MNLDIILAMRPIVMGRIIALPYCAINAVMTGSNSLASLLATNFFFLHIMIDMAEVFTVNNKLPRVPRDSLEFQRVKVLYNAFQVAIWSALLGSAVAVFFVHPLLPLAMVALYYYRAISEYKMWRIVNDDFIQRMRKRMEARRSARSRRGVRVPSMAGA